MQPSQTMKEVRGPLSGAVNILEQVRYMLCMSCRSRRGSGVVENPFEVSAVDPNLQGPGDKTRQTQTCVTTPALDVEPLCPTHRGQQLDDREPHGNGTLPQL